MTKIVTEVNNVDVLIDLYHLFDSTTIVETDEDYEMDKSVYMCLSMLLEIIRNSKVGDFKISTKKIKLVLKNDILTITFNSRVTEEWEVKKVLVNAILDLKQYSKKEQETGYNKFLHQDTFKVKKIEVLYQPVF